MLVGTFFISGFLPNPGSKYIIALQASLQERSKLMLKVIATDVVISKGYDGAPALRFSEKGVRFRVGKKVYDTPGRKQPALDQPVGKGIRADL